MKKVFVIISILLLFIGLLGKLVYEYTIDIESAFLSNRNFYWFFSREELDDVYSYHKDNKTLTVYETSRSLLYEYDDSITIETAIDMANGLCNQEFAPGMETNYYYMYTCNDKGKRLVINKNLKLFWVEILNERPMFVYW